jgi:trehalose 6-phosphate phosphatase
MTMTPLFSAAGQQRLDEIIRPGVLCAFDFDGTLAPIVPHPDHAYLPAEARGLLVELSEYAPVAIITGRAVDDITTRLGFTPHFVVGNHGLEGVPGWEAHAAKHEAACVQWRQALETAVQNGDFDTGIFIEDKRYSLSVHYRMAADQARAERQLEAFFTTLVLPPRVVVGKLIYSLMPDDAGHKGSAMEQLMKATGAPSAIYVGDDVTDEDVFRLQRGDLLSVRIEYSSNTAAEFVLPEPQDMPRLLRELIARLRDAGVHRRPPATHAGTG